MINKLGLDDPLTFEILSDDSLRNYEPDAEFSNGLMISSKLSILLEDKEAFEILTEWLLSLPDDVIGESNHCEEILEIKEALEKNSNEEALT